MLDSVVQAARSLVRSGLRSWSAIRQDVRVVSDVPVSSTGLAVDILVSRPGHGADPNAAPAGRGQQKRPVVVMVHGGGFRAGSRKQLEHFGAECAARLGIVAVSAGYTVGHDRCLADVKGAVDWTCQNIEAYGGDPDNVFLLGHSAGALLALLAGTDKAQSPSGKGLIRGLVGVSGVYDIEHFNANIPGGRMLFEPLGLLDGEPVPEDLVLVNSNRMLQFQGALLLLVAEAELPLLMGDAVALWKSPRQGKCTLAKIPGTDHVSITESEATIEAIGEFISQTVR
mmetsp:Transcript_5211/g.9799  ORF Transcript_5211/g.9799 Transcript_5211/m.9799 type:complete len:284 (-) Transcript_5211:132-983(-)